MSLPLVGGIHFADEILCVRMKYIKQKNNNESYRIMHPSGGGLIFWPINGLVYNIGSCVSCEGQNPLFFSSKTLLQLSFWVPVIAVFFWLWSWKIAVTIYGHHHRCFLKCVSTAAVSFKFQVSVFFSCSGVQWNKLRRNNGIQSELEEIRQDNGASWL